MKRSESRGHMLTQKTSTVSESRHMRHDLEMQSKTSTHVLASCMGISLVNYKHGFQFRQFLVSFCSLFHFVPCFTYTHRMLQAATVYHSMLQAATAYHRLLLPTTGCYCLSNTERLTAVEHMVQLDHGEELCCCRLQQIYMQSQSPQISLRQSFEKGSGLIKSKGIKTSGNLRVILFFAAIINFE